MNHNPAQEAKRLTLGRSGRAQPAAQPRRQSDEGNNVKRKVTRVTRQETCLSTIVGADVYRVWTDMLHCLVPEGRTHRLAPLVAGMLRFAAERASRKHRGRPPKGSLAEALVFGDDLDEDEGGALDLGTTPPGPARTLLSAATVRLFRDAKVRHIRTSARGGRYTIIDSALAEYHRWFAMPWE